MTRSWLISRRTALHGLGAAIGLPLLEAMGWAEDPKGGKPARAPVRSVFLFVPNGVNLEQWRWSDAATPLPRILQPLAALRDEVLVCNGLNHPMARGGNGAHAREGGTFLTGAKCRQTDGADIQAGVSIDQKLAEKVGSYTSLPSLELGIEPGKSAGNCDNGYSCAYVSNISWRTPSTPMAKEISPRAVFQRLFSARSGARPARAGGPEIDTAAFAAGAPAEEAPPSLERSILDHVLGEAAALRGRVGGADQRKLDEYLDAVRALERRIAHGEIAARERAAAGAQAGGQAGAKAGGGASPLVAVNVDAVPRDYAEHVRTMMDLIVLALQTDTTRVVSFMLGNAGSTLPYPHIGVSDSHHELSHHHHDPRKLEGVAKINTHHVELLAYLLQRLHALRDGHGSLLDASMVLYGSTLADGDRHNNDDLPILLAGRGGGTIRPGRILKANTTLCDLFLAMAARAGCPLESFGDGRRMLEGLS